MNHLEIFFFTANNLNRIKQAHQILCSVVKNVVCLASSVGKM